MRQRGSHLAPALFCMLLLGACVPAWPTSAPAATAAPLVTGQTATPGGPLAAGECGLALVNGTLIDGTGAAPVADAVLVIEGGRIASAGPRSTVRIPGGAKLVDVGGATILPGFINAHVHSRYSASALEAWAQGGVTTVRDLTYDTTVVEVMRRNYALRDESETNPRYARIVASTPMLTAPGGYGAYPITSPEQARQAVNALLDVGADLVKTSFEDDLQGRRWPTLTLAEQQAITAAAHARGRLVSAHVSRAAHVAQALDAGVDDLAHMAVDPLPDDLVARVVAAGVYWTPTLELWAGVGWGGRALPNLRKFVAAGGQVALGTDYGGYTIPFDLGMPMREIDRMAQAGMTPMQIIVAATRNAAHVCGRDGDLGTLQPGKAADVLVVDGDPLADLGALQRVRLVVKGGVILGEAR